MPSLFFAWTAVTPPPPPFLPILLSPTPILLCYSTGACMVVGVSSTVETDGSTQAHRLVQHPYSSMEQEFFHQVSVL